MGRRLKEMILYLELDLEVAWVYNTLIMFDAIMICTSEDLIFLFNH